MTKGSTSMFLENGAPRDKVRKCNGIIEHSNSLKPFSLKTAKDFCVALEIKYSYITPY